jgi:Fe-S oxidoreductase
MCKACKSECPSNVDMAKLKSEFLHHYYQGRQRPLGDRMLAGIHRINRRGAAVGPVTNWIQSRKEVRWLLEKLAKIDRRRSLPPLHFRHFRRWFARHQIRDRRRAASSSGQILLLDDCFTTYHEPHIAQAAVGVLEAAGYEIELAGLLCCARPLISKGFLQEARKLIQTQAPGLARRLAGGIPLLSLEPSCASALADDWPELVPGQHTRDISTAVALADVWLADQAEHGRCELQLATRSERCLAHVHCHQSALYGKSGTAAALRLVRGLDTTMLDAGCCGMAGSFGFDKKHYDISVAIANLALVPALAAEPAALVVATGTSCRHQIRDLTARHALHPMELLESALRAKS